MSPEIIGLLGEYGAPGLVLVMLGIVIASQLRDRVRPPTPCEGLRQQIERLSYEMHGLHDGTRSRIDAVGRDVAAIGRDIEGIDRDIGVIRARVGA